MRHTNSYLVIVVAVCVFSLLQCSKSPTDDDADQDHRSPELIADLHVLSITSHSLTLQWTAPTDYRDDNSQGMIQEYDLRVSYDSIAASNFSAAYRIDSVPPSAPAGVVQQAEIDLLEPDSTYYFAMKARDDKGNWSGISNCCMGHCPPIAVVTFGDAALEAWVRGHIGKPTGAVLSTDVDSIEFIDLSQAGISSLSGMEYFLSLHGANLWGNSIVDLAPLSGLTQIWGLSLGGNQISNLTPLSGMAGLRQLHVGGNPVSDLSPLASVTSLQQLFIDGCPVTDFSPLYGLAGLDDVLFSTMQLTDISFMAHLSHIRICKLNGNDITSVAALSGLTAMQGLDLSFNAQLSDIGPLSTLTNLQSLDISHCQVSDLQSLVDNSGLGSGDVVYLYGDPLSSEAINVQIPALESRGVSVMR